MPRLGVTGFPLSHTASPRLFAERFARLGLTDWQYDVLEQEVAAAIPTLFQEDPELVGVNVTIPHKQGVMPHLDLIHPVAERIGAVNCIKRLADGTLKGYNTDYAGFRNSLERFVPAGFSGPALVLGTGGASKAVAVALDDMGLDWTYVSRTPEPGMLSYDELRRGIVGAHPLVINTTPLGMSPQTDTYPPLHYEAATPGHYFYDLVYNPAETLFLKKAAAHGAHTQNGAEMLQGQADAAWDIWNDPEA